ncbi:MAG: alpha/beta fold hydrolase [Acidimicrobiia bacterium]
MVRPLSSRAPSDLAVTRHPAGVPGRPRVVLVHGAPDRSRSFRKVIPLLADLDVTVYDRRGYGESVGAPLATSLDDHVADLVGIVEQVAPGGATVVGHSFGCNVAVATAIHRPDLVRSVGAWELPIPWVDWWPTPAFRDGLLGIAASADPEQLGEDFTRGGLAEGGWERLPERLRLLLRAEGRAFQADIRTITTPPYDIDALATPAVFAAGGTTTTGHREAARLLGRRPGASLMVVEGAGHFGPANHPDDFAELVRRAVRLGWPTAP